LSGERQAATKTRNASPVLGLWVCIGQSHGPLYYLNDWFPSGGQVTHRIGEFIVDVGELAGVVVDADPRTGVPTKYASAYDLRRAFGYRWAKRVMPAVLQKLMRHALDPNDDAVLRRPGGGRRRRRVVAASSNTFSNSDQNPGVGDGDGAAPAATRRD